MLLANKIESQNQIFEIFGLESASGFESVLINECKNAGIKTIKDLAIKFSSNRLFFCLEDILIDLIGEDAYDDFADENGL